ncbi:uncharacterized protein GLRG_04877, partial [Colletotrichum graminicola M1.001]
GRWRRCRTPGSAPTLDSSHCSWLIVSLLVLFVASSAGRQVRKCCEGTTRLFLGRTTRKPARLPSLPRSGVSGFPPFRGACTLETGICRRSRSTPTTWMLVPLSLSMGYVSITRIYGPPAT